MQDFIRRIVCILLCLQLAFAAWAQHNALSAIEAINTAYHSAAALRFTGNLKMYRKGHPEKVIEKIQSAYILKGNNFICSIGPVDMLLNDSYYVSVDKSIRLMIIGYRKDLSGTAQMPVLNTAQFKEWITANTLQASVMRGHTASVLQLKDGPALTGYKSYSIMYDNTTGYMKKALLEAADNNDPTHKTVVLEINYTTPVNTVADHSTFSEKSFFSMVNNKVQPAYNYKGYQIINQLY